MGRKSKFSSALKHAPLETNSSVHKSGDKSNAVYDQTSKQELRVDSEAKDGAHLGHCSTGVGHSSKSKESIDAKNYKSASAKGKTKLTDRLPNENFDSCRRSSANLVSPQSSKATPIQVSRGEKTSSNPKQPKFDSSHPNFDGKSKPVFEFIDGDLFSASDDFSLAHCVGEDMAMGAGIAVHFRNKFHRVGFLLDQHVKTGGVAILETPTRFVYNLVTKRLSTGKPTMNSLISSLREMKIHIVEHNVNKLAIPEIGSGLDNLDWDSVLQVLREIFCDVGIHIQVYHYKPDNSRNTYNKLKTSKMVEKEMDLVDIANNTALLYIVGDKVSESMVSLDKKHNFIKEYRSSERKLGEVIRIKGTFDITYGFICVDGNGKFSYEKFETCLLRFCEMNISDEYVYAGMSTVKSPHDQDVMLKISNILKYCHKLNMEVWLCDPVSFPEDNYELLNCHEWEMFTATHERYDVRKTRNFEQNPRW